MAAGKVAHRADDTPVVVGAAVHAAERRGVARLVEVPVEECYKEQRGQWAQRH